MKLKRWILLASSAMLLASCGGTPISDSEASSGLSSSEASSGQSEDYLPVDWDEKDAISDGMSVSGTLIDIAVDEVLLTDFEYTCGFGFTNDSVVGAYVKVSDNGVAEAEVTHDGAFTLRANRPGETILRVYDASGYLHYRYIARFRAALGQAELQRFMFEEVDHYESNYSKGSYVTFLGSGSAMFSGSDEGTALAKAISFEYEYSSTTETEYCYTITTWDSSESGTTLVCTAMNVDKNGYMLHLLTRNGLVDFFTPVFAE